MDFGYFEFLDGPGNVIIEDESPNSLDFSVDSWGLYDFAYHLCDTFATVTVGFSCPITVPNAFTPDGDGINDFFEIKGEEIKSFELWIYNRWGELVFHSNKINNFWDGRYRGVNNQIDVYVWKIKYEDSHRKNETLVGHVSLIR